MAAITQVAQNNAAPSQAMDAAARAQDSISAERKLLDYVARFQAEGLASRQGLANPAALSGEALKSLKGYFERATSLQESAARKTQPMSENGSEPIPQGSGQLPELSAGPARERLEPGEVSADRVSGISNADLDRTVEALMEVLSHSVETSMITTATSNITKSGTTLLRGQ